MIPILKPHKSKFDKESYRPISLTCCLCKIMEKIINIQLRWFLESNNIINKCQSGFRNNCSTYDCLVSLEENISYAVDNNQSRLSVCLDMEKAYDLVWRKRILHILKDHKILGNTYQFIKNFLSERFIQVRINNILSEITTIDNGVPQGQL